MWNEITIPTNRTNRSIRQSCTGSPSSLMRCNCPIDDRTCRIDSKLFHLTNRTNRSNRQHFVHFSLMKCNFPIHNKQNVVLLDGIYSTVLDMSGQIVHKSEETVLSLPLGTGSELLPNHPAKIHFDHVTLEFCTTDKVFTFAADYMLGVYAYVYTLRICPQKKSTRYFRLESSPYKLSKVNYSPTPWWLVSHRNTCKSPRQTDIQTFLFGVLYKKQYVDNNFQITENYKQQVIN